jgi:hypothetical protein
VPHVVAHHLDDLILELHLQDTSVRGDGSQKNFEDINIIGGMREILEICQKCDMKYDMIEIYIYPPP